MRKTPSRVSTRCGLPAEIHRRPIDMPLEKLKIFISWSGDRSRAVAEALRDWLPDVLPMAEPWMSADVEKGAKWSQSVSGELEKSNFAAVCLTPENLTAPWLLFDAVALRNRQIHVHSHICSASNTLRSRSAFSVPAPKGGTKAKQATTRNDQQPHGCRSSDSSANGVRGKIAISLAARTATLAQSRECRCANH